MSSGPTIVSLPSKGLPLFDAILDLPHPGAAGAPSSGVGDNGGGGGSGGTSNTRRIIPPSPQNLNDNDKTIIKELLSEPYLQRISSFCFPYNNNHSSTSSSLTKYDIYSTQYTSKSFDLEFQLKGGIRVCGFVHLYLPPHIHCKGRTDVGRRSPRALIILVRRHPQTDLGCYQRMFYRHLLSTLESIVSLQHSSSLPSEQPQQVFESVSVQWKKLGDALIDSAIRTPPNGVLSLSGIEFSSNLFQQFDKQSLGQVGSSPYMVASDMYVLPLLRRVGPSILLRLMAAILCERRIILTSTSPQRLTHAIAHAIPSLLSCGMLHWHHVRVPLMLPNMLGHLAAPCPYICGVLSHYQGRLKDIDNLGQVLLINLDTSELHVFGTTEQEAHVAFPDLLRPIDSVDLRFSQQASMSPSGASSHGSVEAMANARSNAMTGGGGGPGGGGASSIYEQSMQNSSSQSHVTLSEVLASDLTELLRYDKSSWSMTAGASGRTADTVVESFSNVTAKAGKGIKRFLAKKASNALGNSNTSNNGGGGGGGGGSSRSNSSPLQRRESSVGSLDDTSVGGEGDNAMLPQEDEIMMEEQRRVNEVLDGFWHDEFAFNLRAEEDVRISVAAYFCCLLGEHSTYLSKDVNNAPIFDKKRYMDQRKLRGDYEGTPMHTVLHCFVQTQMLQHFVQTRIESLMAQMKGGGGGREPTSKCMMEAAMDQLRQSKLDYSWPTVRRVVQQISNGRNSKMLQTFQTARDRVLALTSKNGYEVNRNARADLAQLTEACRVVPMVRATTMSVLLYRIADSKGMQSKHALLSLIVLKHLLLNGPLVCVSEISEYTHVIRVLRVYQSRISAVNARDIRVKATEIYELLVDRPKLFEQRKKQADLRREALLQQQKDGTGATSKKTVTGKREARFVGHTGMEWRKMRFTQVHALVKPQGMESTTTSATSAVAAMDLLDLGGGGGGNDNDMFGGATTTTPNPFDQEVTNNSQQTQKEEENPFLFFSAPTTTAGASSTSAPSAAVATTTSSPAADFFQGTTTSVPSSTAATTTTASSTVPPAPGAAAAGSSQFTGTGTNATTMRNPHQQQTMNTTASTFPTPSSSSATHAGGNVQGQTLQQWPGAMGNNKHANTSYNPNQPAPPSLASSSVQTSSSSYYPAQNVSTHQPPYQNNFAPHQMPSQQNPHPQQMQQARPAAMQMPQNQPKPPQPMQQQQQPFSQYPQQPHQKWQSQQQGQYPGAGYMHNGYHQGGGGGMPMQQAPQPHMQGGGGGQARLPQQQQHQQQPLQNLSVSQPYQQQGQYPQTQFAPLKAQPQPQPSQTNSAPTTNKPKIQFDPFA